MPIRRYLLELGGSMLLYVAVLVASILFLQHHAGRGALAQVVALMPMLPAALVCWAMVRHMRRIDEMQQRIMLEALGVAFAGTAMVTFGYGFLEGVGYPRLSMFVVWPMMAVLWNIGLVVGYWRYR